MEELGCEERKTRRWGEGEVHRCHLLAIPIREEQDNKGETEDKEWPPR